MLAPPDLMQATSLCSELVVIKTLILPERVSLLNADIRRTTGPAQSAMLTPNETKSHRWAAQAY